MEMICNSCFPGKTHTQPHETARFFKEISSTRRDGLTILNIQNRINKWEINMDILKMMIL